MSFSNEAASLGLDHESNRLIVQFASNITDKTILLSQLSVFNTEDSVGPYVVVDVLDEMHSLRSFRVRAFKQRMIHAGWSEDAWKLLQLHPRTTTTTAIFLGIIPLSGTANIREKLNALQE